jgi:hypothetical protein
MLSSILCVTVSSVSPHTGSQNAEYICSEADVALLLFDAVRARATKQEPATTALSSSKSTEPCPGSHLQEPRGTKELGSPEAARFAVIRRQIAVLLHPCLKFGRPLCLPAVLSSNRRTNPNAPLPIWIRDLCSAMHIGLLEDAPTLCL